MSTLSRCGEAGSPASWWVPESPTKESFLAHQVTYEQPNPRVDAPTLGVVSGSAALWLTDIVESLIGLTLVTGHLLRAGLWRSVSPSSGSCHPCARCRITFVKETL